MGRDCRSLPPPIHVSTPPHIRTRPVPDTQHAKLKHNTSQIWHRRKYPLPSSTDAGKQPYRRTIQATLQTQPFQSNVAENTAKAKKKCDARKTTFDTCRLCEIKNPIYQHQKTERIRRPPKNPNDYKTRESKKQTKINPTTQTSIR